MSNRLRIDWLSEPPIILVTGAATANVQLAEPNAPNQTFVPGDHGSYWVMGVSGSPAYINFGPTNAVVATAANVLHPIGRDDTPKAIPAGTWVAALAFGGGSGQVFFVRCYSIGI